MKQLRPTPNKATYTFLGILGFLLLFVAPLQAAQFEEEVSSADYLFVNAIVQAVSPEDLTLTLKQKKGPTITISLDKDTVLEGFYHLSELEIRQKVKVWYRPDERENRALKILKPLELGC